MATTTTICQKRQSSGSIAAALPSRLQKQRSVAAVQPHPHPRHSQLIYQVFNFAFSFSQIWVSQLLISFHKKGKKEKSFDFWPRAAAVVDRAEESQKMNGKEEDFFFYSVDY